jgi:hypothetical protein
VDRVQVSASYIEVIKLGFTFRLRENVRTISALFDVNTVTDSMGCSAALTCMIVTMVVREMDKGVEA